jgi:hypothetical protein
VKKKTVGMNITKPTIINVDNDNIKAMNNRTKTNTKAKPKNMKKPKSISTIRNGIEIIIKGEISNANKNKNGNPSMSKGNNIMNRNPRPSKINGLNITSKTKSPPKTKAPIIKNVPIVKNIKLPMNNIVKIAIPPNTNTPASINGNKIVKIESKPLAIIVATIENAIIGSDKKNIKVANPIQNTIVTPANTIVAVIKEP